MGNMGPEPQRPEGHYWPAGSCSGPTTVECRLPNMYALILTLESLTDDGLEVAQSVAQAGPLAALKLRGAVNQEGSAGEANQPKPDQNGRQKMSRHPNQA
jgi:hypothetical protein